MLKGLQRSVALAKKPTQHLIGGKCGENRVLSEVSVELLEADRSGVIAGILSGWRYGMGWWIPEELPGVVVDVGLFGSIGWLDTERGMIVSREAIRLWCIKFGALYARRLKRKHFGIWQYLFHRRDLRKAQWQAALPGASLGSGW
jgi:hypothetical protein